MATGAATGLTLYYSDAIRQPGSGAPAGARRTPRRRRQGHERIGAHAKIPLTEALFNPGVQVARRKLGDAGFAAAWAQGRAMSLDTAIAGALTVEVAPRGEYPARLSAAEVEVLRRLAGGWTTAQIAAELVVAVSTVDRHITHIYQKIGRRGRAAAAAFALEHGLT